MDTAEKRVGCLSIYDPQCREDRKRKNPKQRRGKHVVGEVNETDGREGNTLDGWMTYICKS
jgi:hypothetical protein